MSNINSYQDMDGNETAYVQAPQRRGLEQGTSSSTKTTEKLTNDYSRTEKGKVLFFW